MVEQAVACLREADTFATIEFLNQQYPATAVVAAYNDLLKRLYWDEKRLDQVVALGRAGLQFGLDHSNEMARHDLAAAKVLREAVRVLAYHLASFAWPGWDEPGIVVSRAESAAGLDAARLSLRLTLELDSEALKLARAYLLLGLQLLSAEALHGALGCFRRAELYAERALHPADKLAAVGYAALAQMMLDEGDSAAVERLRNVLRELGEVEDGEFLAAQLGTAVRVLLRGRAR